LQSLIDLNQRRQAKWKRKEAIIDQEGEEKVSSLLAFLGLLSTFLAALNQFLRLGEWRQEEAQKDQEKNLAEDLEALEARVDALDEELARLEAEKDCQE
jgi:hypothetical protein